MPKTPGNIADGVRLRETRERLLLSRAELAQVLGRTEKTIAQVENGWQTLGPEAWRIIARLEKGQHPHHIPAAGKMASYSDATRPGPEARDDPATWAPPPPAPGPPLDRVAAIVADTAVQTAAAAMIGAGIAPATAWRAILEAKLREATT